MLIADIKGKLPELQNWEDYLTSCVFSTFKYLPECYLQKFLQTAINIKQKKFIESIKNPQYEFWKNEKLGNKRIEPDVVIKTKDLILIIEAKYKSGQHGTDEGPEGLESKKEIEEKIGQYRKEYCLAEKLAKGSKKFYLILVTEDSSFPNEDISKALDAIKVKRKREEAKRRIFWTRWHNMAPIMANIVDTKEKNHRKLIAQDMLNFLNKRNLNVFEGFNFLNKEVLEIMDKRDKKEALSKAIEIMDNVYAQINALKNDLKNEIGRRFKIEDIKPFQPTSIKNIINFQDSVELKMLIDNKILLSLYIIFKGKDLCDEKTPELWIAKIKNVKDKTASRFLAYSLITDIKSKEEGEIKFGTVYKNRKFRRIRSKEEFEGDCICYNLSELAANITKEILAKLFNLCERI